ncbi:MAG TPA: 2-dehydropantoate 2-reductase N-terminal domain-containing protein [Acidimicrobiales bacterium]|nr:2-dehydropantoate 2-reductase N-terminal domain-containing protein [Acidimicrobiales bacterium]
MGVRRYVVFGAGAVGGTIGAVLANAGREVAVIARGRHGEVLRERGLTFRQPSGTTVVRFALVAGDPTGVDWRPDDVVVLAMKTQDTTSAVDALADVAPATVSLVCAQNGVENERIVLRRFADVHGMCVMLPASHLEPGVVVAHGAPAPGILDVGRAPGGADATDHQVAADLTEGGFSSVAQPAILRWKYAKLRMNLGNAFDAACADTGLMRDVVGRARREFEACVDAAGIDVASPSEDAERRGDLMRIAPVEGHERQGGSSWQSLARGLGSIEADYLNGEVVLLGRLHGVATPVNAALQRVARRMAVERRPPRSMAADEMLAEIERAEGEVPQAG